MTETRLDSALAARGLARSRTHAATLITGGRVSVDGKPVIKVSVKVTDDQTIDVAHLDHYVSRAAHKLIAALNAFDVDPRDRLCLDVGASTGGFTQVLLERGARRVIALDVGHGQIVTVLRSDERVDVVEGFNARDLTPEALTKASGVSESPTLVVSDLSFISLPLVLPAVTASVDPSSDLILLIKPQFEVGRTGIKEGIVRSVDRRSDAISNVLWSAWDLGWGTAGLAASPILGGSGNHEYLAWLSRERGSNPTEWMDTTARLALEN